MKIAPHIRVNDGKLSLICVQEVSRPGLLRLFPAIIKGRPIAHPQVHSEFIQSLALVCRHPLLMNVDGELISGYYPSLTIKPGFFHIYLNNKQRITYHA